MSVENIEKICAIGTGTMLTTALPFAMAGYEVSLYGSQQESLERANKNINAALAALRDQTNLVTEEDISEINARITYTTHLAAAAADADFVIESSYEDLAVKHRIFSELDNLCPPHAIFATNSSSLLPSQIVEAVSAERHDKVLGAHFFNPPHLEELVEVIPGPETSQDTKDKTMLLMKDIGKDPMLLKKEIQAALINRIQTIVLLELFHMHENEAITFEDADRAMKILGRRWTERGPVLVSYFGGFDIFEAILNNVAPTLNKYKGAPPLLQKSVAEGHLGMKSGGGGHIYPSLDQPAAEAIRLAWSATLMEHVQRRGLPVRTTRTARPAVVLKSCA